jgi:hypothetical protein
MEARAIAILIAVTAKYMARVIDRHLAEKKSA